MGGEVRAHKTGGMVKTQAHNSVVRERGEDVMVVQTLWAWMYWGLVATVWSSSVTRGTLPHWST